MRKIATLSGAIFLLGLSRASSALTVRVESPNGAPRITVNGATVRARMFWGAPGSAPLRITPEGRETSFEFVAAANAPNGTMHFRFGQAPGEAVLDDIHVVDLDDKRDVLPLRDFENGATSLAEWNVWPPPAQNTVGKVEVAPQVGRDGSSGVRAKITAPPDGIWPDFHVYHNADIALIEGHHYRVTFWAQATPARDLTVAFYRPGATYIHVGGPMGAFENQIKLAAGAGVNFVSFPCSLPWPEPGQTDEWSVPDAQCAMVLRANQNALLIPRIGMDPPSWWCKAHPDDVMQWDDGGHGNFAVPASPVYRREAAQQLAALIRHLEAKFGERVAGYHPGGQNTAEWFYEGTWKHPLNGYAPADLVAWRGWLKAHYETDAALQKAWNQAVTLNAVTLDAAAVPTPIERHAAPNGIFRDPQSERHLIDWAQFQQDAMADCVTTLAHAAREASQGRKLVLFFYGYLFEFGPVANGPATSGHYALRRVLNSPDIDVLCSPISYFDRGLGGSAPTMTAAESVALAGKMWLCEDDTHTYLATGDPPGSADHVTTIEDTNSELTRNVAQESLRNFGTWWMDLTSTGWFNDPAMWAQITRLNALDEAMLKNPTPFRPEVAAIIDERAMLRVAADGNAVTGPGIYEARRALGRMGAPYGMYLQDEVTHAGRGDISREQIHAKLYVLLNSWALSSHSRTKLLPENAFLLRGMRDATKIWCYAPGLFDDYQSSPEAMRQLTGFALKPCAPQKAWATPTEAGRKLGLTQPFGLQSTIKPLFAASDATGTEILATYPDGSAAIALRRTADGPSLFVGVPGLTSELLRLAAREAGVHLFTQSDCNVYANGPFVALHAAQDGPVEVNFGKNSAVFDVLSGAKIGVGPKFTLPFKRGDTRVLRY